MYGYTFKTTIIFIQKGEFDHLGYNAAQYGDCNKVVGLERGPLSLVSATEELLDRKIAAPV
jgi:hypothetical protein